MYIHRTHGQLWVNHCIYCVVWLSQSTGTWNVSQEWLTGRPQLVSGWSMIINIEGMQRYFRHCTSCSCLSTEKSVPSASILKKSSWQHIYIMYSIHSIHLPTFKCLTVLNNVVITVNNVLKCEKTNSCVLHCYVFKYVRTSENAALWLVENKNIPWAYKELSKQTAVRAI